MMMDEARKRMAEEILVKGYVELTPENIKYYFDGFVFSGRNGFYYEQLNKSVIEKNDYEPHYTFEDYIYALYNGGLKDEKYIERQKTKLNIQMSFSEHDKQKKLN